MQRRPKGYGTVYKLSGNRLNPWVTAITEGKDIKTNKQIQKIIAYSNTEQEAENKLYMYHLDILGYIPRPVLDHPQLEDKYLIFLKEMAIQNIIPEDPRRIRNIDIVNNMFLSRLSPFELESENDSVSFYLNKSSKIPSLENCWESAKDDKIRMNKWSNKTIENYDSAFLHFSKIKSYPVSSIGIKSIQPIFDDMMAIQRSYSVMNTMKAVLQIAFKYAEKYGYIKDSPLKFLEFEDMRKVKNVKDVFTNIQIKKLIDDDSKEAIFELICIFTGMRPSEVLLVKKTDVDIDKKIIRGGIKTAAGRNRIIPLHEFLYPYIRDLLSENDNDYLFTINGKSTTYSNIRTNYYNPMKKRLGLQNALTPHSGRKTFSTLAKECGMSDFYRKAIMGHSHKDLTDDIYTVARIEILLKEVNKIKIDGITD